MVAVAAIGSAVIGAGVGIYGANKAAGAQTRASKNASDVERQMYDTTRGDLAPYRNAGSTGTNALMGLAGLGPNGYAGIQSNLESLPGYQFTRTQGLKAVQNSAAARGLGVSGAALKGAANYATGLANSTYGDQFNRLMGISQLGENAAAQTGAYGTQTANNIGQNIIGAGNAQAAGAVGGANAVGNAANSIGNLYTTNALLSSMGYTPIF